MLVPLSRSATFPLSTDRSRGSFCARPELATLPLVRRRRFPGVILRHELLQTVGYIREDVARLRRCVAPQEKGAIPHVLQTIGLQKRVVCPVRPAGIFGLVATWGDSETEDKAGDGGRLVGDVVGRVDQHLVVRAGKGHLHHLIKLVGRVAVVSDFASPSHRSHIPREGAQQPVALRMQDDAWAAEGRWQRTADDGPRPPPRGKLGAASGFAWHPWLARTFCGVGTVDDEANLGQVVAWLSILKHLVQLLHSGPRVLGHLGSLLEVFRQMRPLGDREHAFPAVQAVRRRARQVATVVLVNRHAHCSTGRMGGVVEGECDALTVP
mmetsp:Transcript_60846/g.146477  ORF Transcript_60846/g.146477 Transcript_60846/m.146477 type:complete len:324 (+) Transcript_60846:272-1243(+)